MPREREEFFRSSNTLEKEKVFILAFEGNSTEELYFEGFKDFVKYNDEIIYIHLLKREKRDTRSAPKHVFLKLKNEARDVYNFGIDDELWMIIDTDRWTNIPDMVDECKKLGNMFVAVSNPCFEFWLLLHVKNIKEYSKEELELILENKKISLRKHFLDIKIAEITGSYNKRNPDLTNFLPHIDLAVAQARELDSKGEAFPTGLGSHIYKLIEKLQSIK